MIDKLNSDQFIQLEEHVDLILIANLQQLSKDQNRFKQTLKEDFHFSIRMDNQL